MFNTQDLQRYHQAVEDARNAVPFDQAAYDAAFEEYMQAIETWRVEGMDAANDARRELKDDPAMRRLFGKK